MPDKQIPHQSVICLTIYYELCERLPTGQVGTKVIERKTESLPFTILGTSLTDCQEKTQAFLQQFKDKLNAKNKPTQNT